MKDLLDLNKRAWDNLAERDDDRSGALKEFSECEETKRTTSWMGDLLKEL